MVREGPYVKQFKYLATYAVIRSLDIFVSLWPRSWALCGGEALGLLVALFLPKRRRLILDNLKKAFPDKTEAERRRIARIVWKNLGRTAIEFVRMPDITSEWIKRHVTWEGTEHMERALNEQKGVVLTSPHFTNWEIAGVLTQVRFGRLQTIGRPVRNPYVDRWVLSRRTSGGMRVITHREAVKASLKWLKLKNIAGMLIDQNLYTGGVFVDFFGRPAATSPLPALLRIRTGAPVVLTTIFRKENGGFHMVYEPPMKFPSDTPDDDRPQVYTQIITKHIENVIRRHPENWFWIHNRWKRQPQ